MSILLALVVGLIVGLLIGYAVGHSERRGVILTSTGKVYIDTRVAR